MLCCCLGSLKRKTALVPTYFRKTCRCLCTQLLLGKDLVLDVAVTCPLQHKYLHDASVTAGFACNEHAKYIKQKNYQDRVEQEGFVYLPFILESFGGFSSNVSEFIHRLSSNVGTRSKSFIEKIFEMIYCVLMKSLARSVSSRFEEFCH